MVSTFQKQKNLSVYFCLLVEDPQLYILVVVPLQYSDIFSVVSRAILKAVFGLGSKTQTPKLLKV